MNNEQPKPEEEEKVTAFSGFMPLAFALDGSAHARAGDNLSCSCFVSQEVVWNDDSKKEPIVAALRAGGCSLRLVCSVFVWSPFLFVSHDHRFLFFCWGLSLIIGFVSQATRMKRCGSSGSALA